jgi:hypothetical protein
MQIPTYDPLDRPIWGAKAIGEAINRTRDQAYHLLEKGYLDADKVGGTWVSSLRRLLKPQGRSQSDSALG